MKKNIWLLTLLAGLAGGTIPTFSKIALESMHPGTLTLLRYTITIAALLTLVFLMRQTVNWKNILRVLPVSTLAAINAIAFAIDVQHIQTGSVQLLYTIIPLLVALLSWFILKQTTSTGKIFGLCIGFSGVAIVVVAPIFNGTSNLSFNLAGTITILIGATSYAFYTVLSKPAQEKATPSDMLLGAAVATLICQALYSLLTRETISLANTSLSSFMGAVVVGLVGTALFYWLYQYIVKSSSPLIASTILYIQPIAGALLAFLILKDQLGLWTIIGGATAIVGVGQVNGVWARAFNGFRKSHRSKAAYRT